MKKSGSTNLQAGSRLKRPSSGVVEPPVPKVGRYPREHDLRSVMRRMDSAEKFVNTWIESNAVNRTVGVPGCGPPLWRLGCCV